MVQSGHERIKGRGRWLASKYRATISRLHFHVSFFQVIVIILIMYVSVRQIRSSIINEEQRKVVDEKKSNENHNSKQNFDIVFNKTKNNYQQLQHSAPLLYNTTHPSFLNSIRPFSILRRSQRDIVLQNYFQQENKGEEQQKQYFINQSIAVNKYDKQNYLLNFFISDYLKFHESNRWNESAYFLVFRPHHTGMGDRFGFMVYAFWWSVLTRRVFLIDWLHPFPISELFRNAHNTTNVFYRRSKKKRKKYKRVIDEKEEEEDDDDDDDDNNDDVGIGNMKSGGKMYISNLEGSSIESMERILLSDVRTVVMQTNRVIKSSQLLRFLKRYLHESGLLNETLAFPIVGLLLSIDFQRSFTHHILSISWKMERHHEEVCRRLRLRCPRPRKKISKLVQHSVAKNLQQETERERYIGVHARIGIGVGEMSHSRFRNLSMDLKKPAYCLASRAVNLSKLNLHDKAKALPIFLATDTPIFRPIFKEAVKKLSGQETEIRVIHGEWQVTHSNFVSPGRHINDEMRKVAYEGFWASCMDLLMLGHSEHLIGMYSSFPRFAIALGDAVTLTELRGRICDSVTIDGSDSDSITK